MSPKADDIPTQRRTVQRQQTSGLEPVPQFLDFCSLSRDEIIRLSAGTDQERKAAMVDAKTVTAEQILRQQPMTVLEHTATVLFLLFGVPNGAFSIPVLTALIGKFVVGDIKLAFQVLVVVLMPLAIMPQKFLASSLHSWIACQVVKYFSFRFIHEERPPRMDDPAKIRPQILVAPPHGVFPYGNLLAMIVWPLLGGYHMHGLASSAALVVPWFKQVLKAMGVVDADRKTARQKLEHWPHTIGISTGGVAEVFETNAADECILLKERIGLIKLAIRTGADLVPCYLFGNTRLLSCWAGEGLPNGRNILEKISRRIGFALIIFHGRHGLPLPRRVPVLGVKGRPISTHHIKSEEPTKEQIELIQGELIDRMHELFENYKHLYGWEDKRLIIK